MQISTDFIDEITTRGLFCAEADRLADFCNNHYGATIDKICVGVSGGADSLALLLLANYWAEKHGISICCVTVDHQLRQESAEEAKFVKDICETIGVFHKTIVWQRNDENIPHTKLENTAREARYNLLAEFCLQHDIPILMTAHHWNDQLETYEMRRDFNSSESGLAGMSQVRSLTNEVWLERPLLHFSKKHLQAFLKQKQISWKEDPMNTQAEFLRVNYRRKIFNYDTEKIAEISQELMELSERRQAIESGAVRFLKQCCYFTEYGYAIVNRSEFQKEKEIIQCEVLKRIIWNIGGKKYATPISSEVLQEIMSKKINTIGRCLIKLKKDKLYVFRENRNIPHIIPKGTSFKWDNRFLINLNTELSDCIVQSTRPSEDLNIPREACIGYPCLYRRSDNSIHDRKNYDIVFMNKVNLFDIFV